MSSYGSSIKYVHKSFGSPSTGGSGSGSAIREYAHEVRLSEKPQKVRLFPGRYGVCEACGCGVMVNMEGKYKCAGHAYAQDGKLVRGADNKGYQRCGHEGVLPPENISPVAVNYSGFAAAPFGPTGKGIYVSDQSMGGRREVPSLTTHFSIKVSQCLAHNVFLYGTWHKVTTEKKKARSDGKGDFASTIISYARCAGALGCAECKAGSPKQNGLVGYVNPGPNHSKNLEQFNRDLSKICKSCKTGNIIPAGFTCASCGDVVYDFSEMSLNDRNTNRDLSERMVKCQSPTCGYEGFPVEVPQCLIIENDDDGTPVDCKQGCENPVRADIFNFDLKLTKKGEGTASAYVLEDYAWPDPAKEAEIADKMVPIDFSFLWDPSTGSQAGKLSRENPFEPKNGAPQGGTVSKGSTTY